MASQTKVTCDMADLRENLRRAILPVTAIAFVIIISMAFRVLLQRLNTQARLNVGESLSVVVRETQTALRAWYQGEEEHLEIFSRDSELVAAVSRLLEVPRTRDVLISAPEQIRVRQYFEKWGPHLYHNGFFIIAPDGTTIASLRDMNLGLRNRVAEKRPALLQKAFGGEAVFIPPVQMQETLGMEAESETAVFSALPIWDEKGAVIAVLMMQYLASNELSRICQVARFKDSGETYAFDRSGRMLTQSRFVDDMVRAGIISHRDDSGLGLRVSDPGGNMMLGYRSSLSRNLQPLTRMAATATAGQSGVDVIGYRDYRGVRVLGAWVWDDMLQMGVASELNEKEALASYQQNERTLWVGLVLLIALTSALLGVWFLAARRTNILLRKARDKWESLAVEQAMTLVEKERRFRAIFEGANDAIMLFDDGTFFDCNAYALKLFGVASRKEFIALHPADLSPPYQPDGRDSQSASQENIEQALREGHCRFEWMHSRVNGETFPAEVVISAIEYEGKKVLEATVRDISERKEAEAQLVKLSRAIEFSPASVIITDAEGHIEYVNRKFVEVTGYASEEAVGRSPRMLKSGKMPPGFYQHMWGTILAGKEWHGEICNRKKNGEFYWKYSSISPIQDERGHITHYVAVNEDITDKKRDEEALARHAAELRQSRRAALNLMQDAKAEHKRAEEARVDLEKSKKELQLAKEAAEAAARAKSDFLANMSHEIRTPLNAIIGMGYLMKKTALTDQQAIYLHKMQSSSRILLGTINDILDFSKIEADAIALEQKEINFDRLLNDLASIHAVQARDKGVELLFCCSDISELCLIGDSLRLTQILNNLIANAIKFTESGSVTLRAEVLEQMADRALIRFDVEDTGIGLTREQQEQLFRPFTQADGSTTRKFGGTGLGLSICKRLTELMGGEISVESRFGKGSCFSFTVNLEAHSKPVSPVVDALEGLRDTRLLIVDDREDVACYLKRGLGKHFLQTEVVHSGDECLQRLEGASDPFGLVLVDLRGPDAGFDTCRRIKQHKQLSILPKVLMCGVFEQEELPLHQFNAGYDSYLTKPFICSNVSNALTSLFRRPQEKGLPEESQERDHWAMAKIQGARILLAEDNEMNQDVAIALLETAGIDVRVAQNGLEAIAQLNKESYDLVLMDVQMPIMDGYEATRRIRNDERFKDLPVIAMTANVMEEDIQKALNSGMNAHIGKPILPGELYQTLLEWIRPVEGPVEDKVYAEQEAALPGAAFAEIGDLDVEAGLLHTAGNSDLYTKMLLKFSANYAEVADEIRGLLALPDYDGAQRRAHTLKGVAGTIGARALQQASASLESAIRERNDNEIESGLVMMATLLKPLVRQIRKAFVSQEAPSRGEDGGAVLDASAAVELVHDLRRLLSEGASQACERFEVLRNLPGISYFNGLLSELSKQIECYAFEEAVNTLNQLEGHLERFGEGVEGE